MRRLMELVPPLAERKLHFTTLKSSHKGFSLCRSSNLSETALLFVVSLRFFRLFVISYIYLFFRSDVFYSFFTDCKLHRHDRATSDRPPHVSLLNAGIFRSNFVSNGMILPVYSSILIIDAVLACLALKRKLSNCEC